MKSLNIYWSFLIIVLSRRGKVRKIRMNQKFHQYGGIFNLASCRNVNRILEWVKVIDLWGVDRKEAFKLKCEGIRTALDLKDADPSLGRKLLTIRGSNIQMELQGISAIGEDIPLTHSCAISSRSLGYKAKDNRAYPRSRCHPRGQGRLEISALETCRKACGHQDTDLV